MGLFQKKKAAIERKLIESTHEIVCLYCFSNFDHNEVVFRAAQVMDKDGYRLQPDTKLDVYRARFNMPTAGEIPPVLNPDNFKERNKGYHHGILSTLYDAHNNPTSIRLCPHCHNNLLPSAGFEPCTVISVVGGSGAGKSTYLTSLIHTIKTVTAPNFEMYCAPLSAEIGRKFKAQYEDPLLEKGILPAPTHKDAICEPLVFTLSFTDGLKPDINIVFFDTAGEGAYADIYAAHIRNASSVLFLVDPLQFHSSGQRTQILNHLNYDLSTIQEPINVMGSLVESYIHKQPNGISGIPTAMVLTKTDLMKAHSHHNEYIHPKSNLYNRYVHRGYFSLSQLDAISYEVDAFLRLADPNFQNALKRRFANLGLFGVSALGAKPDTATGRVSAFAPVRVDEPFLWVLYKLGYIEGRYEEKRLQK